MSRYFAKIKDESGWMYICEPLSLSNQQKEARIFTDERLAEKALEYWKPKKGKVVPISSMDEHCNRHSVRYNCRAELEGTCGCSCKACKYLMKKTATRKVIHWFARCKNIARMGPYPTQVAAAASLRIIPQLGNNHVMAEGAFVWPEETKVKCISTGQEQRES